MTVQLIPVFSSTLSNEPSLLCNARDLHAFLEVGKHFASWITERINEYEFVENQDYILVSQIGEIKGRGGDRRRKDYHLTLDTAKELAMVERNEKGRQIRRYFIECEKELRQVKTTSTEQRLPLRDAVKMLVRKKSIRYEDAYRLIHQRFSVGHIDEIEEAQLPVAIEYIHRLVLEGELIRESYTLTDSEKESFNTNLHALCHNVRCINDIWKAQLRPALLNLDSPLAARLHDRFASNMCILPIIEKLVGRHVPDSPR